MSRRLVPAYVERPAWAVYDAYVQYLDDDDLDALRDAVTDLGNALVRADAFTLAPDWVLAQIASGGLRADEPIQPTRGGRR